MNKAIFTERRKQMFSCSLTIPQSRCSRSSQVAETEKEQIDPTRAGAVGAKRRRQWRSELQNIQNNADLPTAPRIIKRQKGAGKGGMRSARISGSRREPNECIHYWEDRRCCVGCCHFCNFVSVCLSYCARSFAYRVDKIFNWFRWQIL